MEGDCNVERIVPARYPVSDDAKIFHLTDEEGNQIGKPYSFNDWIKMIEAFSGVNSDLMGSEE